jgi:hypothetical protein
MLDRSLTAERLAMTGHDQDSPMLPMAEAARRLGKSQDAVRSMVRRGRLTAVRGNDGRLLVPVPADLEAAADQSGPGDGLAEALAEADHWRERAHQAELEAARARAELKAAGDVAAARLETAMARAEAQAAVVEELKAMLAEARRPWWRTLWG